MNTTSQMNRISGLSEHELRQFVAHQASDADLTCFWGQRAAEVRALARLPEAARKRGDSLIVLLPGLMGSTLEDAGDDPQLLWINPLAYVRGHLNRLDLAPDGRSAAQAGVRVRPRGLVWIVYARLLLGLQPRYAVTTFPYDWRLATWDMADALRAFIDEKTAETGFEQVTLVGHSLGGLLALDYLTGERTRAHAERRVKRAIMLGAPFRGALPAVTFLTRGGAGDAKIAIIEALNPQNDALRLLRTLPSLYQILPAPRGLYPGWDPVPGSDIWDAQTWAQQGVPIHTGHLERARAHHDQVAAADPQTPVYCVAGALYNTPVRLEGGLMGMLRRMWEGSDTGDGTVAIASAVLPGRPAYYVNEVHTELVLERTVIDAIQAWVEGAEPAGLVRRLEDVVQADLPMRAAEPGSLVTPQEIARKTMADEPLDHAEIALLSGIV